MIPEQARDDPRTNDASDLTMSTENPNRFRAALVQLRASRVIADNLVTTEALIRQAALGGADYIQTPENTALMELEPALVLKQVQPEAESVPLARFRGLAAELAVWLHIGSLGIMIAGLGAIAPSRRGEIARLGFRAIIGGSLAAFMTACIAGILT